MSELTTLSFRAAGRRADSVLVVPLGATEQHGPHLPLTTDTDIADALARRLAEERPSLWRFAGLALLAGAPAVLATGFTF